MSNTKQLYEKYLDITGYCPDCFTEITSPEANFCTHCRRDIREFQTICKACGKGIHAWMYERGLINGCGHCGKEYKEHPMSPYEKLSLSWKQELIPCPA